MVLFGQDTKKLNLPKLKRIAVMGQNTPIAKQKYAFISGWIHFFAF